MQQNPPPAPETATQSSVYGLSAAEAAERLRTFGKNELEADHRNPLLISLWHIATEPMFILLAVACILYFFLGDFTEAMMMVVSILFVAGIELYQETKSERALEALRRYTRAQVRVKRDGEWIELPGEELVPGDLVRIEEGERIAADGFLIEYHDLSVDESVLTGESLPVEKGENESTRKVYQGTTVASGNGLLVVSETGARTEFGKLGKSIESVESAPTPLQKQIKRFVQQMGIVGGLAFILVFVLNYWAEPDVWKALLFSLTLAMAILPEEIPVAFSAFMGLGAYRMIQHGILAKKPQTVESLGSATVICLDKTGTITENRMSVAEIVDFSGKGQTLQFALWASEPEPFDAMEKALLRYGNEILPHGDPRKGFALYKEYPLGGKPPMMTHIWENKDRERMVACKGAVERILNATQLDDVERERVLAETEALADRGYRVLGVAGAVFSGENFPTEQDAFDWEFEGLVAFYDPPKENVGEVFQQFYKAGIRIMMITGDHVVTAKNIARNTGFSGAEIALTGNEVMAMDDESLQAAVQKVNIFARMFPDAKLRVVNALKATGETVAMSGDGVNDGPALKAAQIGVAMGKKGTEIAKSAASLVLLEDNLHAMTTAIGMGRRLYDHLRKAIRYVISIHLPIILVVLLPLLLGWQYVHILLPLHVIFLELVMDPIAAIAFENEPAEPNLMRKRPRPGNSSLFSWKELGVSLLQGAAITASVLYMYHWAAGQGKMEDGVRSVVFATLVSANLFLTLSNRSFDFALHRTLFYKNRMLPVILFISVVMLLAILYLPFLAGLFKMTALTAVELGWCVLAGFVSIIWFELYKALREWLETKAD
ncbi:MAG: cation-translocating P-type ATPase [Saprospiraceae bacterium]|nr:cation-translocating P-type ATPase [Saprospiraceae bacterium]